MASDEKRDKSLIIFTYAPAGVGQLRVTDALYTSRPKDIDSLIFGSHDKRISRLHRMAGHNFLLRKFIDWLQQGFLQYFFTKFYRKWLRMRTNRLYEQISILLNQYLEKPEKLLIISSHFALAHQLAVVKKKIKEEYDIDLFLVVQMTDAAPRLIWLVLGADLIVAPDNETKLKLEKYASRHKLEKFKRIPKIKVLPYPLNPLLVQNLTSAEFASKRLQVNPEAKFKINVSVPVPGAAVNLDFFSKLINYLLNSPSNYQFFLVSKFSNYTKNFIYSLINKDSVQIYPGKTGQQVVIDYLRLHKYEVISLEVTNPTEQAFKALLDPVQRGGSILLFCEPACQREVENLKFLQTHDLLPDQETQKEIFDLFAANKPMPEAMKEKARYWRGLQLPQNPIKAANFIQWLYEEQIFLKMLKFQPAFKVDRREINDQGVNIFWQNVNSFIE